MIAVCTEEAVSLEEEEKSRTVNLLTSCKYLPSHDGLGPRWKFWRRRRDILCILSFFGYVNVNFLRHNLSIAIVAMTSQYPVLLSNGTVVQERDFDLDSVSKGLLLSAFFYGYILSQIPGGWLAYRFGGHRTYGIGVSITAFLTLITPVVAGIHIYLLVVLRFTEGLCEGTTLPSIELLIARWTPLLERNRFVSLICTGVPIGAIVSMALSGYLASTFGWKSVFYVSGFLGAAWTALWWLLASEDPSTNSSIAKGESLYIMATRSHNFHAVKASKPVVWLQIISSLPICSMAVAVFVASWNFHVLATQMPSFMTETVGFDLRNAGFISAVPYVVATVLTPFFGYAVDIVLKRKLLCVTMVRKLSICGSLGVNSVFFVLVGYLTSTPAIVACHVVFLVLDGFATVSINLNCLDVAPQYSSIIIGIMHTISGLSGTISPVMSGYIVKNKLLVEWRTVFIIAGCLTALGAVVYGLFGSGEKQVWSAEDDSSKLQAQSRGTTDVRMEN